MTLFSEKRESNYNAHNKAIFSNYGHSSTVGPQVCYTSLLIQNSGSSWDYTKNQFCYATWECNLIEFNGEPDHIHMLLELNPKIALSTFINNLKTVSSRYIRKDFSNHLSKFYYNNPIFWSRSYCILTCGGAPLSVIEQQARVD